MKWRTAKGFITITEKATKLLEEKFYKGDITLFQAKARLEDVLQCMDVEAVEVSTGNLIQIKNSVLDEFVVFDKEGNELLKARSLLDNGFFGSFEYKRHRSGDYFWFEIRNITFLGSKWLKGTPTSLEGLVEKPVKTTSRKLYNYQGEDRTLNTIAKMNDVTYQSLKTRLDDGLPLDEAISIAKSRKLKH